MLSFVLGIIGSVIGFICSIVAVFYVSISQKFQTPPTTSPVTAATVAPGVSTGGWGAILFSILALISSFFCLRYPKIGGTLIIICAIGGFNCISKFYSIPSILFVISGLISLFSKQKESNVSKV